VIVFGRGETPVRYVASDDVVEAVVHYALADDPPRVVEFGGPDRLTRNQAVDVFEEVIGEPIRRRHVPRAALRVAAVARPVRHATRLSQACAVASAGYSPLNGPDSPARTCFVHASTSTSYSPASTPSSAAAATTAGAVFGPSNHAAMSVSM
jgi:nucleoside-diphosphate-sugar epimerase